MALLGMEWLGAPADPGGKLAEGFALGSSFMFRRNQQQMEQEKLAMVKDEFVFDQTVMRPLEVQLKQAQIDNQKVSMVSRMLTAQAKNQMQQDSDISLAEFGQFFAENKASDPEFPQKLGAFIKDRPQVLSRKEGIAMFNWGKSMIAASKQGETLEIGSRALQQGINVDPSQLGNPQYMMWLDANSKLLESETKAKQKQEAEMARVTFQTNEAIRLHQANTASAAKSTKVPEAIRIKISSNNTAMAKDSWNEEKVKALMEENDRLLKPYMPEGSEAPIAPPPPSAKGSWVKEQLGQIGARQ